MNRLVPQAVVKEAEIAVADASAKNGIVNVSVLAETLRSNNPEENVALEDVEQMVLSIATNRGAIVVFDRSALSTNIFSAPTDHESAGLASA